MDSRWQLTLFGGLSAKRDEQAITRFRTQKTGLLLAYLAYYRQRSHSRETLIHMLWPDCDPKRGRDSLSTELVWLRRELEPPSLPRASVIVADRDTVRLSPDAVLTDVAVFKRALRSAQRAGSGDERTEFLARALGCYQGDLLPDYDEDWVLQERHWLAELYFQALDQLLRRLEQGGDFHRALRYARRGTEIDPLREEAHRQLMRLYVATGQSTAALRQYQVLERLLREQLGVAPAAVTRSLAREIERLTLLRPAGGQALGRSGAHAVRSSDGENRLVTVLVVEIGRSGGLPANQPSNRPAALGSHLQTILVDVVLKYEGCIDRFLKEGVMAIFGVPHVHEDDAERAIRAAIEIREAGCQLGVEVTAAINTGEVPVRAAGPEELQEAVLANPVVDLAFQLQQQGVPGQILVGEATYRQTQRAFAFVPSSSGAADIAQCAEAYLVERALPRPEKARGIDGLRADLIGRDEELARLQAAYAGALQGEGQMVCIIGEAGVGKSRLVAELKSALSVGRWALGTDAPAQRPTPNTHRPPLWLEGRCLELGMTTSYSLWVDLFRDYFAITQGSGTRPDEERQTRGDRLIACLREFAARGQLSEERLEEMGPLLGHLLSVHFGSDWDERLKNASPEQIRYQTLLAVRDFFLALARSRCADTLQPVVLVCEDLHWADTLSLDLISLLMETLASVPLLLLCVYRPEQEHRCRHLASIARRKCPERYTELHLRELTPEQSRRMIESLLSIDSLPHAVKELILEKTRGNPFFVEEIIRSLMAAGLIYQEAGGRARGGSQASVLWRAREGIEAVQVPESVQSVILSRVDRLTPDVKHLLQSASVMGRLFRRRWLEQISDDETDLERALWELEDRQLIYQERVMPEEEYSFNHVLTQETIYRSLRRRQREALHQRVGEALESLYGDGLDEYYEQVAYHYERSNVDEKAVEYLLKAGEKARLGYLNEAAISYFQRGMDRLDRTRLGEARREWRLEALTGLGRVYQVVGKSQQAEECFRQAIAVGKQMKLPPRELVRLHFWLADVLWWLNQHDERIRIGTEGLAWLEEDNECVEAALMNAILAEKGNQFHARNAQFIQRLSYTEDLRVAYAALAFQEAWSNKNREKAVRWLHVFEQKAQQYHDLRALSEIHIYWAQCIFEPRGDFQEAIAQCYRARELAVQIGDRRLESWALILMTGCFLSLGDLSSAAEAADQGHAMVLDLGNKDDISWMQSKRGTLFMCQRRLEAAADAFRRSVGLARETGVSRKDKHAYLGRAYLAQGKLPEASGQFQEVVRLAGEDSFALAGALSGLEEAKSPDQFRVTCFHIQKEQSELPGRQFARWFLEPAQPVCLPQALFDDPLAAPLPEDWIWCDPHGDCSYTAHNGLKMHAANGRDLCHSNLTAPRLLRPASGEFGAQTVCAPLSSDRPAIGGLLLWKDRENFLRLDRGTRGPYEISFQGCLGNEDVILGRGRLPSDRVFLRLERMGGRVHALCSADGEAWFTVGQAEFPIEDPVEVGLHAIGMIDRTIYPGAFPEGTAIRFEAFQLWRSEQPG